MRGFVRNFAMTILALLLALAVSVCFFAGLFDDDAVERSLAFALDPGIFLFILTLTVSESLYCAYAAFLIATVLVYCIIGLALDMTRWLVRRLFG